MWPAMAWILPSPKVLHQPLLPLLRMAPGLLAAALALLALAPGERPVTEVTLAGEGKLGLAFAKKRVPLTLKQVAPGSLAAAFPELVPGMQLISVGEDAATELQYPEAVALLRDRKSVV